MFLDKPSREKLLEEYPATLNKVTANHVTLLYKPLDKQLKLIAVGKLHQVSFIGFRTALEGSGFLLVRRILIIINNLQFSNFYIIN